MKRLARALRGLRPSDATERGLAVGAAGSLLLKVANAGLMFLTGVVLARLLGAESYGAYALAFAWSVLLGVPAVLGMDRLVMRATSVYRVQGEWGLARGMYRRANQATLAVALLLAGTAAAVANQTLQGNFRVTFLWAMLLVPLLTLMRVRKAATQGLNRVVIGQMPELLLQHVFFLVLIAIGFTLARPSSILAVQLQVAAVALAFIVGVVVLVRARPAEARGVPPRYATREWTRAAIPLTILSGIHVINGRLDIVMVGWMEGQAAAGLYDVATKGSDLVSFALLAINQAVGPTFASLLAEGKLASLQRIITKQTRITMLLGLGVGLGMVLLSGVFLALFGPAFAPARAALIILVAAQVYNAAVGPVGLLLIMAHKEAWSAVGFLAAAVLNGILNLLLIPRLGIDGAAIATLVSTIAWNTAFMVFVYRAIGIRPGPVPGVWPKRDA